MTVLAAQEKLTEQLATTLFDGRYYRVNSEPSKDQAAVMGELDSVSERAAATLRMMAEEAWETSQKDPRFNAFFGKK